MDLIDPTSGLLDSKRLSAQSAAVHGMALHLRLFMTRRSRPVSLLIFSKNWTEGFPCRMPGV